MHNFRTTTSKTLLEMDEDNASAPAASCYAKKPYTWWTRFVIEDWFLNIILVAVTNDRFNEELDWRRWSGLSVCHRWGQGLEPRSPLGGKPQLVVIWLVIASDLCGSLSIHVNVARLPSPPPDVRWALWLRGVSLPLRSCFKNVTKRLNHSLTYSFQPSIRSI